MNAAGGRRPAKGSQARADRTRALVIDETVRCVLEEGFAAASAKHICERAGVTWGVIQYHFGDVEGLMVAVVDHGLAIVGDELRALQPELEDLDVRQRAQRVVASAWDSTANPTSLAAIEIVIGTRGRRAPTSDRHLSDIAAEYERLGRYICADLHPKHAAVITALIWNALRGMVIYRLMSTEPDDTTEERDGLVDVVATYVEAHVEKPPARKRPPVKRSPATVTKAAQRRRDPHRS